MEEYIYLNTKDEDYILLGNDDAFKGKERQTEAIINVLKEYYEKIRILKILRDYLVGYEIGLIEKRANKSGLVGIFDYKTGTLEILGEEEEETLIMSYEKESFTVPYEKEYRQIQTESLEKAHTLVKNL